MPQLKDSKYIATVRQAIIPTWAIVQVRNAYETFKVEADNNTLGDDGDWGGALPRYSGADPLCRVCYQGLGHDTAAAADIHAPRSGVQL